MLTMKEINKAGQFEDFLTQTPKVKPLEDFGIDKIASGFAKSKLAKVLFAGLGVTSVSALTACNNSPRAAETAPLPSGSETSQSHYTLAAATAEAESFLNPTVEPTLKPTETKNPFEGLEVCVDWKKPCPATEEDLMSGRLIDFAKSVGQPFPKEAYNTGQMSFGYSSYGTIIGFDWNNVKGQPSHPEQELYRKKGSLIVPYRWMMHFWVPYNGITYQVSIQQWLNTDASVSYLQYVIDRKDAVYKNGMSPTKTLFEEVGEVMPVCEVSGGLNFGDTLDGLSYNDQERAVLIKEWEKTGVIPEQLQYKILLPDIAVSNHTKKLP